MDFYGYQYYFTEICKQFFFGGIQLLLIYFYFE